MKIVEGKSFFSIKYSISLTFKHQNNIYQNKLSVSRMYFRYFKIAARKTYKEPRIQFSIVAN